MFPAVSLGFTIFGETFAYVAGFFCLNPSDSIGVVTFCLHGWCMLGLFLLLAFTCLGHARQDPLSLCYGMHVLTD